MKRLTSDANPLFRRWLRLATHAREIRTSGQTLAEGLHLAQAASAAGHPVQAALMRHGSHGAAVEQALAALPAHTERFELAAALYDRISPVEHGCGLMLLIAAQSAPIPVRARHDLVYLDGVQDPTNVGALLRTAAAAGARHVLCGPTTAAAWSPRALRAGMGAHFRLAISESVEPAALQSAIDGPWIGAVVQQAVGLWNCVMPDGPVGWAFGSEGAGLCDEVLAQCALRVTVPMAADTESLNVAAAAAVCLFERQRRLGAG